MTAPSVRGLDTADGLLTVIITIRAGTHYDMVARLRHRLLDTRIPSSVVFSVIDEGSAEHEAARLQAECESLRFSYHRVDSDKHSFCASTARNVGVAVAKTPFVMHEDVDLFPYPGFYQDLVDEIFIQGLHEDASKFLTVPALYLSEEATSSALNGRLLKNQIINDLLTKEPSVTTYMPASSVIVVNRMRYLSVGGYNDRFNGWGLEDLEFAYRLTRSANTFISPADHQLLTETGFSTNSKYRGWRSQFRLHGELLARKGIFIFHAHHPKDTAWRNNELHNANKRLFHECIETFDKRGHFLPSIPMPDRGKSLIFGKGTFAYNPTLQPLWGEIEVKGYQNFENLDIVQYVKDNRIDRVIFTNPYANEQRLTVYNKVRSANIPYYVVERGALTDSMFIDDTGFCCESTRYRRDHWPLSLDDGRRERVTQYILSETSSSSALEKQGERLGSRAARHKLGLPSDKKILFVPFQSRSDTTVNYFAGDIGSFDNFVELVREVAKTLPSDWAVLVKNHPLSMTQENVPGAIDVGDMHIKDILELTNYVLLMNSGVGVLSALFAKPVIYTAQAFYADEDLNRKATTATEVVSLLMEGFSVVQESRLRFLSYLLEDFYSFGTFTVSERQHTSNARLTITDHIDYYRVNLLGQRVIDLNSGSRATDVWAPIYDSFREWITTTRYTEEPSGSNQPHVAAEMVREGKRLFLSKKYSEAAKSFADAFERDRNKPNSLRQAAEAYSRAGDKSKALTALLDAMKLLPHNKRLKARYMVIKFPVLRFILGRQEFHIK